MTWIKIDQTLRNHKKLFEAADELNIEPITMLGALVSLWIWALDNAPDGSLKNIKYKTIARGAMYSGDPDEFVKTLENIGFFDRNIDGDLVLHDWDDYGGELFRRRKKEAERKAEERRKMSAGHPQDIQGTSEQCPLDVRAKNKSKNKSKSKSKNKKDISLSPKTGERDESTESTNQPSTPTEKIRELWNETALSLGKVREIVGKRKIMLGARWKEHPDLDWWATYFDRIEASAFLTGKNDRGWKARFDWVIDPTNMNKILEGCYDDRKTKKGGKDDDPLRGFARTADWCEGSV